MNAQKELLRVEHIRKYFAIHRKYGNPKGNYLRAVHDVSFTINEGEVLGLVGESGCGKATLGRTILKLHSVTAGDIYFKGENIVNYGFKKMLPIRRDMQMIFQDPFASLNPRMTIEKIIRAPLDTFKIGEPRYRRDHVAEMLKKVGLNADHMNKFPHEMSGGQRQRVVIARAMISNPSFVVCDEPVSALDVSVRAQVLNLMKDMQQELGTAYLFVSHDLSTVRYICNRIAVMYLGHIVEIADADELFNNPKHPYTKALLSAIPVPDVDQKRQRIILQGDVPSPMNPPAGCAFSTRCPLAGSKCEQLHPDLVACGAPGHYVACFWPE